MKAFNQGSIVIALNMTQDKNLYFDLMFDLVPMKQVETKCKTKLLIISKVTTTEAWLGVKPCLRNWQQDWDRARDNRR